MEIKRVLLGMSGGVDSSAAAVLLLRQGCRVTGCTLRLCDSVSTDGVDDARAVADKLGIPFVCGDYREAFRSRVMEPFVTAYVSGQTPNPCVDCNRSVKFTTLLEKADALGCSHIATGHYARVRRDAATGRWQLLKGMDEAKDQSYFLYPLTQEILSRVLMPLGEYEKGTVRALAEENGLVNAQRRDSQDICFIPDGDYVAFLKEFGGVEPASGDFTDKAGRVLGQHKGLVCYTKGQRRGLGVSADRPLYVVAKDAAANRIILGDNADLQSTALVAGRFNWVSIPCPEGEITAEAKTRYSQKSAQAVVTPFADGRVQVVFSQPQRAVTPGQSVVLYHGDLVLGGGIIEETD